MDEIVWHDNYALGFPALDDDHRCLMEIINELIRSVSNREVSKLEPLSARFVEALEAHYPREERFLKELGCPGIDIHARHHRELLDRAKAFAEQCAAEGDLEKVEIALEDLVKGWLADVRGGDLNFRTELLEKGLDKALAERGLADLWL